MIQNPNCSTRTRSNLTRLWQYNRHLGFAIFCWLRVYLSTTYVIAIGRTWLNGGWPGAPSNQWALLGDVICTWKIFR